ncbi:NADP-dependent oxidoreductase [Mesonia aquimarina]|uniref:NADP-dependent oxidoreductase n=1 Tax=Mesonia aquimarina TaxID=1504967 RepID=UPI000EF5FFBC|nr:NADP-dependent oxidoreductase [Mesonia aquimarina]
MKAIVLKEAGAKDQLSVEEVAKPKPTADEVLVKTTSVGINPIEIKTRKGNRFTDKLLADHPSILGWDLCGKIVQKGENVKDFSIDDQVFGMINFPDFGKTYAEYVCAKPKDLVRIPVSLSAKDAGGVPLAALTAYQALKYEANIKRNTKVLIHAAGGGVGHFGVQFAKHFGGEVWVTCSAEKKDFINKLGADHHINYKETNFEDELKEVDVVFDLIGGDYIDRSLKVLKKGGKIISIPTATNQGVEEKAAAKGCKGVAFKVKPTQKDLQEISDLIANKKVIPHISEHYNFTEVQEAHQSIEKGGTKGKIVITF